MRNLETKADLPSNLYKAIVRKASNIPSSEYVNVRTLISTVIREEAPRFYTSFDRTYSLYRQWIRKGDAFLVSKFRLNSLKLEMYRELLPRIRDLTAKNTLDEAIEKAICSPAPRFYLTDKSECIIYFNYQKKRRHENKFYKR